MRYLGDAAAVIVLAALALSAAGIIWHVWRPRPRRRMSDAELSAVAEATWERLAADQPCPACTGGPPHCTCALNCGAAGCRVMRDAGFADWERDYQERQR